MALASKASVCWAIVLDEGVVVTAVTGTVIVWEEVGPWDPEGLGMVVVVNGGFGVDGEGSIGGCDGVTHPDTNKKITIKAKIGKNFIFKKNISNY